jgi:hypothetical protein
VLAIQDTTEVKFPTQAQRRRGLGPIKSGNAYGVLVHAMLGVDADSHACLGLLAGEVWNRPGVVTTHHRDRPLSERESSRWLETAEQAKARRPERAKRTVKVEMRFGEVELCRPVHEQDLCLRRCGCAWLKCGRSPHPEVSNRCTGGC